MQQQQNIIVNELYEQLKQLVEDWIPSHAAIVIAVEHTYVYFSAAEQNIYLDVGSEVPSDSLAFKVLASRKKSEAVLESSLFNTPYYAVGYPITINNTNAALIIVLPPSFKKIATEPYKMLTGKQNEDWFPVLVQDIVYIESLQKSTWFYSGSEQFKTSITLKELQTKLPSNFLRIHRSFIINIHFIKRIKRDLASNFIVILKDGKELPVSQSYLNNLRTVLEF